MTRVDIIIQGAGIVGSTLALLLANTLPHCKILLLDQVPLSVEPTKVKSETVKSQSVETAWTVPESAPAENSWSPRVSALSLASQAILTAADAWPRLARLAPFLRMRVMPVTATSELVLEASEWSVPYLGLMIENQSLLQTLHERVLAQPSIQVRCGVSVEAVQQSAQQVQVQFADQQYQAQLLVAADGAQSRIAQLVVFAAQRMDYQHSALITHVHTAQHHGWQAQQVFLDNGPLAFLPLTRRRLFASSAQLARNDPSPFDIPPAGADEQYVSLVWSGPSLQQQALLHLSDHDFLVRLNADLPANLGAALTCQRRMLFPLARHHVQQVVQHRVVLIGDAAQRMHPLAGQGLNIGLMDAAVLAANIVDAADLGDAVVLQHYQCVRQAQTWPLMAVIHQLYRHYRPQTNWLIQLLRQQGFDWAANSAQFKALMNGLANAQAYLPPRYQSYWPLGC
jgi:2-octaprenylphenol hydroxylase